jgi:hypothetical protein
MSKLSKEQRRSLERATLRYSEHLDVAAEWLAGRGLDVEAARSKAFGVVIDPIPGHESRRGRLAIPYLTNAGPVNMTFRCLEDHNCKEVTGFHEKYMTQKGVGANLWGVQCVSWADEWIVLTEGELDAFTWQQIGFPALGVSGAEKWKDHWTYLLEDFSRVYVISEGDKAGDGFWDLVSSQVTNTIKVKLPDGEDSNSLFAKHGADALIGRIKK